VIDLLAVDRSGRLAVVELKASADLHLPMQALDYWIRVKWHLDRGEFSGDGHFSGVALRDEAPRLLLASPHWSFTQPPKPYWAFHSSDRGGANRAGGRMAEGAAQRLSITRRRAARLTRTMLKYLKQARAAFTMLDADEVTKRSERSVQIGLVADGSGAYAEMEEFLVPEGTPRPLWRSRMNQIHRANDPDVPPEVDIVLYEPGLACPQNAYTFHRGDLQRTVSEILRDKDELSLALARQFPAFREQVVNAIIHEVAKENALFAIATAVPNIVPNIIEIPWIVGEFASDTVFLTANQVRMAFQIAAACGRQTGILRQKAELMTIVAGAFGWRAIARELVSHIPLGGGLIPKGAIAYAGTFAVGKGLAFFHNDLGQPTVEQRREMYRQGLNRGRSLAENLPAEQIR
jgi:hypothetical protein